MIKKTAALFLLIALVLACPPAGQKAYAALSEDDDRFLTRESFLVEAASVFLPDYQGEGPLPFGDAGQAQPESIPYLTAMYEQGVLRGSEENGQLLIKINELITRQEAVVLLGRLLGITPSGEPSFTDSEDIAPYARAYVAWFAEQGLVTGFADGHFGPREPMRAGQLAQLISKALALRETESQIEAKETYQTETAITTFAGRGNGAAADGANDTAQFYLPQSVFAGDGGLYVADTGNNLIRSISGGQTERVAGDILAYDEYRLPMGYYRDGTVKNALFNRPADGVVNADGRIYIADSYNHAIRVITSESVITLAGGKQGHKDGPAETSRFNRPSAITADGAGNLYIADTLNHCIRKIDGAGNVTTIAGIPSQRGTADGPSGEAAFNCPSGITVTEDGKIIYVADTGNHLIRKIEDGQVATLAGAAAFLDEDGYPLGAFADGVANEALFNLPMGLTMIDGVLIVADCGNHRIRAVLPTGETVTLAGTGEPGDDGAFNLPKGVCAVGDTLYIADTGNNKIKAIPFDGSRFK